MNEANEILCDHRHWLLDHYLRGRRRNPRWSLRAYARRLGISHAALSEILSGKRPLTVKNARRLAERLELGPFETARFVRSAVTSQLVAAGLDDATLALDGDRHFQKLDLETFKIVADWYHFAILCLAEIEAAQADPRWIAANLGITPGEASAAVERLCGLGKLRVEAGRLRAVGAPLSFYSDGYEPAIRHFLHQNLDKAGHSLDHDPAEARELSATILAIDPAQLPAARQAIKNFRRELSALLEKGDQSRVYSLAVQLVPVSQPVSSRKDE